MSFLSLAECHCTHGIELPTGQLCNSWSFGWSLTRLSILVGSYLTSELRRHAHWRTHRHTHRASGTSHSSKSRRMDTSDTHAIHRPRWKTCGRGTLIRHVGHIEHGGVERRLVRVGHVVAVVALRVLQHRGRSGRSRGTRGND